MRALIAVLVLIFSLQSWSKADDISEFEIEGMSIGDSLLDYMTDDEINKELNKENNFYYKNKTYVTILSSQKIYENLKIYDDLTIIIKTKNDKNFIIKGLEGKFILENKNVSECYKKQITIANDIKKLFQELNLEEIIFDIEKSKLKGSKDISVRYIDLVFPNEAGEFRIACHERSNKNLLYVIINGSEFMKALHNY